MLHAPSKIKIERRWAFHLKWEMRFCSLLSSAALFGQKLRNTPAYFASQWKEGLLLMGIFWGASSEGLTFKIKAPYSGSHFDPRIPLNHFIFLTKQTKSKVLNASFPTQPRTTTANTLVCRRQCTCRQRQRFRSASFEHWRQHTR